MKKRISRILATGTLVLTAMSAGMATASEKFADNTTVEIKGLPGGPLYVLEKTGVDKKHDAGIYCLRHTSGNYLNVLKADAGTMVGFTEGGKKGSEWILNKNSKGWSIMAKANAANTVSLSKKSSSGMQLQRNQGYKNQLWEITPKKKATIRPGNLGTGKVFGVNKPGDANFKALKPEFYDKVETSIYAPTDDSSKDLGLVAGGKYCMLMITGKDKQQAFIYWETPDPDFQDILLHKSTEIKGIGGKNFSIQRGDTVTIQAQENSKGPGTDITFTYSRNGKGIGVTTFIVK